MNRLILARVVLRCGVALLVNSALLISAHADLRREVEPNDPASAAQPVVAAASIGGTIGAPGDADIYAVAVDAGQIIKADILAMLMGVPDGETAPVCVAGRAAGATFECCDTIEVRNRGLRDLPRGLTPPSSP